MLKATNAGNQSNPDRRQQGYDCGQGIVNAGVDFAPASEAAGLRQWLENMSAPARPGASKAGKPFVDGLRAAFADAGLPTPAHCNPGDWARMLADYAVDMSGWCEHYSGLTAQNCGKMADLLTLKTPANDADLTRWRQRAAQSCNQSGQLYQLIHQLARGVESLNDDADGQFATWQHLAQDCRGVAFDHWLDALVSLGLVLSRRPDAASQTQ